MVPIHVPLILAAVASLPCDALNALTSEKSEKQTWHHAQRKLEAGSARFPAASAGDLKVGNLCSYGKLLPKLYLLGAQKAGTTSLAYTLMESGVETALKEYVPDGKEWHFFDRRLKGQDADSLAAVKTDWLQQLPDCHEDDEPRLVADFTIINLGMVPLPGANKVTGTHWGWWFREPHPEGLVLDLPGVVSWMYGAELRPQLRFAVLIRKPIARMQSAWYHARAGGWSGVCADCRGNSFMESLTETMAAFQSNPPVIKDWLWHSLYARQIYIWREYFSADQFFIALFGATNNEDMSVNCRHLMEWTGFAADCAAGGSREEVHINTNPHISLDTERAENHEAFERFRVMMDPELQKLAGLLAGGQKAGMHLQGYKGPAGAVAGVRDWIVAGW